MAVGVHNKIINQTAKEILSPHGIFQKGKSRLWIDDNGWFLTIIEFQPSGWSKGSYLNVGLHFLWTETDYITFGFSYKNNTRIFFNNGKQFIWYENDKQFVEESKALVQMALDKALYYRQYKDLDYAKKQILESVHRSACAWMSWNKLMICLLSDDKNTEKYLTDFEAIIDLLDESNVLWQSYNEIIKIKGNLPKSPRDIILSIIIRQRDILRGKEIKNLSADTDINTVKALLGYKNKTALSFD